MKKREREKKRKKRHKAMEGLSELKFRLSTSYRFGMN